MPFASRTPLPAPAARAARAGALAVAVAVLATAGPAAAQLAPFSLDVRGGVSVPVGAFERSPAAPGALETAGSFGAAFVTRNLRGWGVTAGFGQRRFACAEPGCAGDGELVATDVEIGGVRSFGGESVAPWVSASASFGRVEYDAAAPDGVERRLGDLSVGATAGAGVAVRLLGRWGLNPALRYAWTNATLPGEGLLRMRYLMADVGVLLTF